MITKKRLLAAMLVALLPLAASASTTADEAYDQGHAALNKAWELEAQSIQMGYSANARLTYLDRATDARLQALALFDKAIAADASHYQAHSVRGLVLRKLGRHEEALAAYDRALSINDQDLTTVEYRGEAFVELGRIDDAKAAYFQLAKGNEALAKDLLAFMKIWLDSPNPTQRALLQKEEYRQLLSWIEERMALSKNLAMASSIGAAERW